MALTDEQISAINGRVDEFRVADYKSREKIIRDFCSSFNDTLPQGVNFDKVVVNTVCAPSATLDCSQIFLAYSPVLVWKNQADDKEICSQIPKSDG